MVVGKYKALKLRQLFVDQRYQRYRPESSVMRIVSAWCWLAFTPVCVVKRGKKYSVLDGQTRLLALMRVYPDYEGDVPCWVFLPMPLKTEADLFILLNLNNKPVGSADRYHAGLTAGDKEDLATDKALRKAGIIPVYGNQRLAPGETKCAYAFVAGYLRVGAAGLKEIIKCVQACRVPRGEIDPEALKATFIAGAAEYVARGGKAGESMSAGRAMALAGRESGSNGHRRAPAIADVLKKAWGSKRR